MEDVEFFPECRICLGAVVEEDTTVAPRQAFGLEDQEVYVPLCDCTNQFYHVGCIYQQLEAWSNRATWDRCCDVCKEPWRFMPRNLPVTFDAPLHHWVAWDAEEKVFRVREEVGGESFMEGVVLRVGPGTASTPSGPLIPMADAYTTVQVELPESPTGPLVRYFEGTVGSRVPWPTVYLLFFGGGT